jgi:hypothetical protein
MLLPCRYKRSPMWLFGSCSVESLSITIYVLCIYMQIVLYMKTFLLCKSYGFCYVPAIKVYQHKLNKKEFKLAFKLWCACLRSSFSLSIIPDDDIHIFLLCANHTQVVEIPGIKSAPHPNSRKKKLSTLSLSRIHLLTMQIICKFTLSVLLPCRAIESSKASL